MRALRYLLFLAAKAAATTLYVSSYDGNITALNLTQNYHGCYSLTPVSITNASAPSPSWLHLDTDNHILWATNEGEPGTVTSYNTSGMGGEKGELVVIEQYRTIAGPVYVAPVDGGRALALAC